MRTVIFDSMNAIWRLQKKMPVLTANGKQIQVVYGFLRLIRSTLEDFEPQAALVVWDGEPRLRKELYSGYKEHRHAKREEEDHKRERGIVLSQVEIIQKTLKKLSVNQIYMKVCEADDIIALACRALKGTKIIISADQDMLQLVNEDVRVYSPMKQILYTHKNFEEKTGLTTRQFLEMRVLVGDKTDEIPGVAKGFGEGTAKQLIQKYGDIETLFQSAVEKKVKAMGRRQALLYSSGSRFRADLNMRLMDLSLVQSAKAERFIKREMAANRDVDGMAVMKYFKKKKFQSLIDNFIVWLRPFKELRQK